MRARLACAFVCAMLCLLGVATSVFGQSDVASVAGRVLDPNGAIIIEATVTAKNVDTGIVTVVQTNQDGIYRFVNLSPGNYEFTVSKRGFKEIEKPGVTLHLADTISMNFNMVVGALTEKVTVEGGVPMINTTDASVSTIIDQTYVKNMPLNGRSFQDLILLTPGIVTQTPQPNNGVSPANGVNGEFSVNGQRPEENYYTVDGVSANFGGAAGVNMFAGAGASGSLPGATALGTTQALVSIDDLQEFRVQSSTYSAEYGRTPGGQFAFETKSGVNQWHGSAFDYLRNDAMDANDWFSNALGVAKPALRQNDFGGTLGGPLDIPHVYSGKDKTFLFFSYEGLRLLQPQPAGAFPVPDAALRASTPAPLSQVLNAFPLQTPGAADVNGVAQFIGAWSNPSSLDSTSIRFDHLIKGKTRVFFRFSDTISDSTTRGGCPICGVPASMKNVSAYTTRTYTGGASTSITSRLNNEFRLNYSSNFNSTVLSVDKFGGSVPVDLAQLTSLPSQAQVAVQMTLGPGASVSLQQNRETGSQRQWNIVDTVGYTLGRHQLKFGVDYRRLTPFAIPLSPVLDYFFFSQSSIQSGAADFALDGANGPAYPLYKNVSVFANDEWKVTPRLNLSMGLRWEVNPPPGVTQGLMPFTLQGSDPNSLVAAPQGTPLWHTSWYNFAPRLGGAYIVRDRAGWETVVRAGGGVFFDTGQQQGSIGFSGVGFSSINGAGGVPFPQVPACFPGLRCDSSGIPVIITDPNDPSFYFASGVGYFFPTHFQLPYTLQWNGSVEQALGKSQTLTFRYVGAHGARLVRTDIIEPSNNPNLFEVQEARNGLTSDYHSGQVQFQRRLSGGLTSLASYTFSHCIDYGSQNYNFGYQRGSCDMDVRHNFTAAFSYDLPNVGHSRLINALVHHWGLDDRFVARSGFPITLAGTNYPDPNTGKTVSSGLDYNSGQPLYLYGAACNQAFAGATPAGCPGGRAINPNAFSPTAIDAVTGNPVQGNAPRNFVRGFGAWQMNLGLRREFPLYESMKLQFRAEAFNIFNHPNFGAISTGGFSGYCTPIPGNPNPNVTVDPTCTFGLATATLANSLGSTLSSLYQTGGPRSMQLSLRLEF